MFEPGCVRPTWSRTLLTWNLKTKVCYQDSHYQPRLVPPSYPQEPFPSSAHSTSCMGDKSFDGEFWGLLPNRDAVHSCPHRGFCAIALSTIRSMRKGEDNRCSVVSANLRWQRAENCHSLAFLSKSSTTLWRSSRVCTQPHHLSDDYLIIPKMRGCT